MFTQVYLSYCVLCISQIRADECWLSVVQWSVSEIVIALSVVPKFRVRNLTLEQPHQKWKSCIWTLLRGIRTKVDVYASLPISRLAHPKFRENSRDPGRVSGADSRKGRFGRDFSFEARAENCAIETMTKNPGVCNLRAVVVWREMDASSIPCHLLLLASFPMSAAPRALRFCNDAFACTP